MSLHDPFKVPNTAGPPSESTDSTPPPCKWLLPLPEDAEPRTKREACGAPAPFTIRVKDFVSDAEVDVCARHKGEHDVTAANLRAKGKPQHRSMRRKAG